MPGIWGARFWSAMRHKSTPATPAVILSEGVRKRPVGMTELSAYAKCAKVKGPIRSPQVRGDRDGAAAEEEGLCRY